MKTRRIFATLCLAALATVVLVPSLTMAQEQQRGSEKYLCSEPNPEAVCTAENTCGSSSTACTVEIKRTSDSASATPVIPNAKGNQPFCVKAGTKVIWKSGSKNTGFVLDFGPQLPFGTEAIMGGSDRSPSTVANKKGCYKYSVGACVSGAIYGMCESVETELIITGAQ
jgi:hypothetical protein